MALTCKKALEGPNSVVQPLLDLPILLGSPDLAAPALLTEGPVGHAHAAHTLGGGDPVDSGVSGESTRAAGAGTGGSSFVLHITFPIGKVICFQGLLLRCR